MKLFQTAHLSPSFYKYLILFTCYSQGEWWHRAVCPPWICPFEWLMNFSCQVHRDGWAHGEPWETCLQRSCLVSSGAGLQPPSPLPSANPLQCGWWSRTSPWGVFPMDRRSGKETRKLERKAAPHLPSRAQDLCLLAFHCPSLLPVPSSLWFPNLNLPLLSPDLFLPHLRNSKGSTWQPPHRLSDCWSKVLLSSAMSWASNLSAEHKYLYYYKESVVS